MMLYNYASVMHVLLKEVFFRGVGTTGALGAGVPPKIFTLHMHVTQLANYLLK